MYGKTAANASNPDFMEELRHPTDKYLFTDNDELKLMGKDGDIHKWHTQDDPM